MKHKTATATGRHLSHAVILAILATCAGDFYAQDSQTPTAPPREPEASLDDTVIPSAILSPQRPLPAEPSTGGATTTPEVAGPDDQSLLGREQLTGNWWGARTKLADMGIVPAASFTSDAAMNFRGGQNTAGSSFLHLTDVNLTLTSPLLPVAGSSVFLSFQHVNGTGPSEDVGDVQGISSIDSDGRTQLSEAWYKQEFVDGKLAITLGKIDAGSTMGLVEPEGYFINGYLGFQGVIPMPTYPDPSFGLQVTAAPTDRLTLDAGIYDGALQEGYRTGTLGPATLFGDPSDLFSIGQLTYALTPGRWTVTAGGWYHTGTFTDALGGDQDGAYGLYLHTMLRLIVENPDAEGDNQGLSMFAHYGYSDPTGIDTPHHLGAGAVWVGALPGRNDDVAGLGLTSVVFRDGAEYTDTQETSVELFYKIQITPYLSVQPDLQYVINPGGNGASDAIVGTIRVSIDF